MFTHGWVYIFGAVAFFVAVFVVFGVVLCGLVGFGWVGSTGFVVLCALVSWLWF